MNGYTREELRENRKYLELLSQKFPNITSAVGEVVNLKAILNLPKGTEHFLTDIHGEHEAFNHVMQNASGIIKRKLEQELGNTISIDELNELATVIYYPEEKIDLIKREKNKESLDNWFELTIYRLVKICREAASKYTRSKVRKALPADFAYIMEELLQEDEHRFDKKEYYHQIIESLVELGRAKHFIIQITGVIKRLTIDHLHIIGDIFDRGAGPHVVMDNLMSHHSIDLQWGNHDILWMGAAAGNAACIACAVRIALRYANMSVLEDGYGINLLPLATFAERVYLNDPCDQFKPRISDDSSASESEIDLITKMHKAISIIQFKLEEVIINNHPEYDMTKRKMLRHINYEDYTIEVEGVVYPLNDHNFPTIDPLDPCKLTEEEERVMDRLIYGFLHGERIQRHMRFLYAKGSMYKVFNDNLLFHACIQVNEDGSFKERTIDGKTYAGKKLMDKYDQMAREAFFSKEADPEYRSTDFLWYLWCHGESPLFGKDKMATFERYFIDDKTPHKEEYCAFYHLIDREDSRLAEKILVEFGVCPDDGHLINGHIPVKTTSGESPIRARGKQLVIDGGFAKAYQETTGIAGYTLTFNSYGLTLISHTPFESVQKAITDGVDIKSTMVVVETSTERKRVRDTDTGRAISEQIQDLEMLIMAYRKGIVKGKLY